MINARIKVGVGDVDHWSFDFTQWLALKSQELGVSVTIATATWTASGGVVILGAPGYPDPVIFDANRQVRVWWDAATLTSLGASLTCTIVTTSGHERSATVTLTSDVC